MFDESHIGRRVVYHTRSGTTQYGTIRGIAESPKMADVAIEGSSRSLHYIPFDMLRLLEEEK